MHLTKAYITVQTSQGLASLFLAGHVLSKLSKNHFKRVPLNDEFQ